MLIEREAYPAARPWPAGGITRPLARVRLGLRVNADVNAGITFDINVRHFQIKREARHA
jgi:hypothetical protein